MMDKAYEDRPKDAAGQAVVAIFSAIMFGSMAMAFAVGSLGKTPEIACIESGRVWVDEECRTQQERKND